MFEIGFLDCIATFGQCGPFDSEPTICGHVEELWWCSLPYSVVAFLRFASVRQLRTAGHLLGASLGGLADLLSGEMELVIPCLSAGIFEQRHQIDLPFLFRFFARRNA